MTENNDAHDLGTSNGSRAYLAAYFAKQIGRHDFKRYINEIIAADFACALAQHLSKLRAEGVQAGDERAEFEKWCRGKYALGSLAADNRWEAWQARAALASAPVDPEAEDADFLVRVLMQLDTWRVEDWNELIERRPAILALLRPLVMASAPDTSEADASPIVPGGPYTDPEAFIATLGEGATAAGEADLASTPRVDALMARWDDDGATRGAAFIALRDLARSLERQKGEVVLAIAAAKESLFSQCCSNPIKNAWGESVDLTTLNRLFDLASAPVAYWKPIKLSDDVLNFLKEGVENATQCEEADVDQEFADRLLLLMHTPLYTEPLPKQREVDWGPLVVAPVAGEAQPVAWFIDWPDEPELGHYIAESPAYSGRNRPLVFADVSPQESTPVPEERVYAYRRRGLDDFVTCDRDRFAELSAKPRLFETRIFYAAPQASEAVRNADHPVFAFLLGEGPLRGVEFGDRHPDERGAYWWRKDLRAALSAQPGAQHPKQHNDGGAEHG